ncbi:hypothetical protein FF38_02161 [Lucilia cuprina]|uniref:HAT C-terminal dimerisation domain-containing protein n=1 Tax=Lucilia cuprina TaxID=7375 RepID=A0A0L0BQ82_LUCCU|nr:hypothetical protein FF38_02161 [Lucilia cuprina]
MKKKSSEIDTIQKQWRLIADHKWNSKTSIVDYLIEIHNFRNSINENTFNEISEFVLSLLVPQFSNYDVERLFSMMGIIIFPLKNSTCSIQNELKANMLIHILFGIYVNMEKSIEKEIKGHIYSYNNI